MSTQAAVFAQKQYETVIGLEVHVQLKTHTKLFCACSTQFGIQPNHNTCPVCLGLPGVLPVLNKTAVDYAIRIGLALNSTLAEWTKFDRKQYFYPDLPKAYQISQYDVPICSGGYLQLENGKKVRITRAHLEEDAGKLVHAGADGLAGADYSLVDLNRAGTPLVEIVGEPDIRSGEEAREYLIQLRNIVRYLDVCDGNLEEGSMRCDANVSIRPVGATEYGTKAEIKNMNSFKAVQRAIEVEAQRQIALVEAGERVIQESRLWNDATGTTIAMRSKEDAHDYRYFPEPDLRPLHVSADWVAEVRRNLPELPAERFEKLQKQYGLSDYDAHVLVEFKELGDFFVATTAHSHHYKAMANWLMGDITNYLKTQKTTLPQTALEPAHLAELIRLVDDGILSSPMAKKVLAELLENGCEQTKQAHSVEALAKQLGLVQMSDEGALRGVVEKIIADNAKSVADYRAGKDKLFGFFVGQVMKATQGQANPNMVNDLLKELLSES